MITQSNRHKDKDKDKDNNNQQGYVTCDSNSNNTATATSDLICGNSEWHWWLATASSNQHWQGQVNCSNSVQQRQWSVTATSYLDRHNIDKNLKQQQKNCSDSDIDDSSHCECDQYW